MTYDGMTESIADKIEEYEKALTAYAKLVNKQTLVNIQVIAARKRLLDAKDNLRAFEMDIQDVLNIKQKVALQEKIPETL